MIKNYSYTYLLPLLSELVYFDNDILKSIKNTYVFTNKNKNIGLFYILCKYNYKDPNYSKLEYKLTNNELFVTSYEVNDEILYEFNFPKVYSYEQIKFVNGEYSLFKEDSKLLILKFWSEIYGHIPSFIIKYLLKIKQVLYKEEKLRLKLEKELNESISKNSELGQKIDVKSETFIFDESNEKIKLKDLKKLFKLDE